MYKNLSKATILLMLAGTVSCFGDKGSSATSTTTTTENRGRRAAEEFGSTLNGLMGDLNNGREFSKEEFEKLIKEAEALQNNLSVQDKALETALKGLLDMKEDIKEGNSNSKDRKALVAHLYADTNVHIKGLAKNVATDLYGTIKKSEADKKAAKVLAELAPITKKLLAKSIFKKGVTPLRKVNILTDVMENINKNEDEIFGTESITIAKKALQDIFPTYNIDADKDEEVAELKGIDERADILVGAYNDICTKENQEFMRTDYAPEVVETITPTFIDSLKAEVVKTSTESSEVASKVKGTGKVAEKMKTTVKAVMKMKPETLENKEDSDALVTLQAKLGDEQQFKGANAAKIATSFKMLATELGVDVDGNVHQQLLNSTTLTPKLSEVETMNVLVAKYRTIKENIKNNTVTAPIFAEDADEQTVKADNAKFEEAKNKAYNSLKSAKKLAIEMRKGLSKNITILSSFADLNKAITEFTNSNKDYEELLRKATTLRNELRAYLKSDHEDIYNA